MIEIIISDNCLHCDKQKEEMERYFFDDEYSLISSESKEFLKHPLYEGINSVPFIIIKSDKNKVVYSKAGFHDEEKLKKLIEKYN
jgi:hypothetical protein